MNKLLLAVLLTSNVAMAQSELDNILFGDTNTRQQYKPLRNQYAPPEPQTTTFVDKQGNRITQVCYYLEHVGSYHCEFQ